MHMSVSQHAVWRLAGSGQAQCTSRRNFEASLKFEGEFAHSHYA